MEWREEGIVLGVRRHGETSVILELLTEARGRHAGLVRGGRSRQMQAALQPGNKVAAHWRARLEDHLGMYTVEPISQRAAVLMESAIGLHALNLMTGLCHLLAEREGHPRLYRIMDAILESVPDNPDIGLAILRFELAFLDELGFGLDLSSCASTGRTEDLCYVSPKSGRAVSREAGEPYHKRMLPLPSGLLSGASTAAVSSDEISDGFKTVGYFLDRHIIVPRGVVMPPSRAALLKELLKDRH